MIDFVYSLVLSIGNLKYLRQKSFVGFGSRIINSHLGRNVRIGKFSFVTNSILEDYVKIDMLTFVSNSRFGKHSYIGKNGVVENAQIGAFTSISWNVTIGAGEHKTDIVTTHELMYSPFHGFIKDTEERIYDPTAGRVIVGNDVWIGANVVIKRGIKIEDGAVIGAGSIVTKDIPPYAIAVGVPARVIKYRFSKKTIRELQKLRWWEWSDKVLKQHLDVLSSNPEDPQTIEKLWMIKRELEGIKIR
ncbi:hypothetical protein APY94_01875 [Thermococcus celericrescens]|uniref:Acetyltransferase n=2 Tax=Thermococcus celericrescens TaxID=227598 RepID=A0A100XZG6_9EURY|nr:hypothetical protein APY94_01875 [Thermococcus celericrescens]